jgi:hypothetical protein
MHLPREGQVYKKTLKAQSGPDKSSQNSNHHHRAVTMLESNKLLMILPADFFRRIFGAVIFGS